MSESLPVHHHKQASRTMVLITLFVVVLALLGFAPMLVRMYWWNSSAPHVIYAKMNSSRLELIFSYSQPPLFADMHVKIPPSNAWLIGTQHQLPALLKYFGTASYMDCWTDDPNDKDRLSNYLSHNDARILMDFSIDRPDMQGESFSQSIIVPEEYYGMYKYIYIFSFRNSKPTGVRAVSGNNSLD
jgi:hypothetical protein